jgi:hypothetical protein
MNVKRILIIASVAALPMASASADTVFVGNVFVDFVSGPANCTSTFAVGDFARALFRPRGAPLGNGADSHLAYVSTRSSLVMRVPGNNFQASVNYLGSGVGSRANLISNSGGITVWTQSPGAVSTATPNVRIRGRFANFFGITGCFVEIRGHLVKR